MSSYSKEPVMVPMPRDVAELLDKSAKSEKLLEELQRKRAAAEQQANAASRAHSEASDACDRASSDARNIRWELTLALRAWGGRI